jgi:Na+/pantothenate symporter
MITKVFAAADTKVARVSLPITDALFMLFLIGGNLYLGAAARLLVWDKVATAPDQAFPALVTYVTQLAGTPVLGALAITGVVSAAIATADSLLLMTGAAVAHDLLRKCFYEPRGEQKDERFYLRISRITIVIVGAVSLLGAMRTPELVLNIVSYAVALVGVAFFFPMILGLNIPHITRGAAIASSVAGSLVGLFWTVLHLQRVAVPWVMDLHPVVPGLVAAAVPMIACLIGRRRIDMSSKALAIFFPERTSRVSSSR